jgi:GntR family transcriptional regulator
MRGILMALLYVEIKNYILKQIESRNLKAGDKIPTERDLMDLFNVSRMTVRHALDLLVNSGILIRMVGKGTYVSEEKIFTRLNILKSFTEEIIASGHKPSSKLINKKVEIPSELISKKLQINKTQRILKVSRLRLVDDLEMSITYSYFPLMKAFMIDKIDFAQTSLYKEIEEKLGLKIEKAEEIITAVSANQKISKPLRIKKGSPVLKLSRLTIIVNKVPIEYMEGYFRPDRYMVYQELYR